MGQQGQVSEAFTPDHQATVPLSFKYAAGDAPAEQCTGSMMLDASNRTASGRGDTTGARQRAPMASVLYDSTQLAVRLFYFPYSFDPNQAADSRSC